jgi:hypothetical protein
VVIAGGWAAYEFNTTQTARRAQLEVSMLEAESRKAAPHLSIDVQQAATIGSRWPLIITVKVSNNGSRAILVDLTKPRLGVSLVKLESDSTYPRGAGRRYESPVIARLRENGVNVLGAISLAPGTSTEFSYLIIVDRPGLYLVDFLVPVGAEAAREVDSTIKAIALDSAMARLGPRADPTVGASKYVEVR